MQHFGESYDDTTAPVAHLVLVRCLFVLALRWGLKVYSMDTKQAFLNADIKFNLWIRLPSGFKYKGASILKLNKTLEGSKQGAHDWYEAQDTLIMSDKMHEEVFA